MSEEEHFEGAVIRGMELEGNVTSGRELQELAITVVDDWPWDSPSALFIWLDNNAVLLLVVEFTESEIRIKPQDWLVPLAEADVIQPLCEGYDSFVAGVCLYGEGWVREVLPDAAPDGEHVGDELRILNTVTRDFNAMATFPRRIGEWERFDTRGGGAVSDALNRFYALVSTR